MLLQSNGREFGVFVPKFPWYAGGRAFVARVTSDGNPWALPLSRPSGFGLLSLVKQFCFVRV
jgi:hypothetical protein